MDVWDGLEYVCVCVFAYTAFRRSRVRVCLFALGSGSFDEYDEFCISTLAWKQLHTVYGNKANSAYACSLQ